MNAVTDIVLARKILDFLENRINSQEKENAFRYRFDLSKCFGYVYLIMVPKNDSSLSSLSSSSSSPSFNIDFLVGDSRRIWICEKIRKKKKKSKEDLDVESDDRYFIKFVNEMFKMAKHHDIILSNSIVVLKRYECLESILIEIDLMDKV